MAVEKKRYVIALRNIKKAYQSSGGVTTQALGGVDLVVPEGDFVAIMGPSGSGKSSLMNIIGLLDQHYEGTYHLDGKDVGKLGSNRAAEIRGDKIGFVFQHFNLLKRTSVLENVMLPTIYHSGKDDLEHALEVIRRVGLSEQLVSKSNQLSGGQMQRVAIARALIMRPSYLLADEPTGNLDSKTADEIMELFAEINRQGTTIVLITHEEDVAVYAKRIVRLKDGQIEKKTAK